MQGGGKKVGVTGINEENTYLRWYSRPVHEKKKMGGGPVGRLMKISVECLVKVKEQHEQVVMNGV